MVLKHKGVLIMRRCLAFLLAIIMCLSIAACGSESKEEIDRELISVDVLDADLDDNLARAKQHVGKATHLFGRVIDIGTESFTLNPWFIGREFTVPMDSRTLAGLNKDSYIAVYVVIEEIDDAGNVKLKNCKQIEMQLMDEYVINKASENSATDLIDWPYPFINYVTSRGDTFKMTNDDEIASFILGKWYRDWNGAICYAEFFSDGTCDWDYRDNNFNKWKTASSSWSVSDGILATFYEDDTAVYKITNDIMVTGDNLLVRVN